MSQPFNRRARLSQPGELDHSLGEFWVHNPWEIVDQGHNLSAYERNRTYLNQGGRKFFDISTLTTTDSDGDGRAVVAADFRNNGKLDLVVRQEGGGALLLFENDMATGHYLKVSLCGVLSNSLGIGARLTAIVGARRFTREMYPINSYQSQMPAIVHFGLADADRVDQLQIRWPSGETQEFENLMADQHIVVTEGDSSSQNLRVVIPGEPL